MGLSLGGSDACQAITLPFGLSSSASNLIRRFGLGGMPGASTLCHNNKHVNNNKFRTYKQKLSIAESKIYYFYIQIT